MQKIKQEILQKALDIDRKDSQVLAYMLKNAGNYSSREIERACLLRQPEVCVAFKKLRPYLISKEKKKQKGKGRPEKIFSLKPNINTLIVSKTKIKIDDLNKELSDLRLLVKMFEEK